MQVRFDGKLGFGGGEIEPGEEPIHAAQREVEEEFGCGDLLRKNPNPLQYLSTFAVGQRLTTYMYCKELSLDEIKLIEQDICKAPHYG
jgi:8-oxo-dGTP pyrophosphatase MutT (NUDIX family)